MPRPASFLPALVAVAATSLLTVAPVPAAYADPASGPAPDGDARPPVAGSVLHRAARPAPRVRADADPLAVTIDSLSPSYVPRKGPIRITGSVTNNSDETWYAINLHPFAGSTPITSSAALARATDLPANEYVGDRVTAPGNFDTVASLDPGESTQFSIRLTSRLLGLTEPGVYWFGVHASGQTDTLPKDGVADGRARTFLPLIRGRASVSTAIVVPIRRRVEHADDGRVVGVRAWARDLDRDGPLRTLVEFGAAAGDRPLTWLVDPAVTDAVRSLVSGNPARSLADTVDEAPGDEVDDPTESATPQPSDEPSPSESASGEPTPNEERGNAATDPGNAWLDRFREAADGNQVLVLPYGDMDVAAAAAHDPLLYQRARQRSARPLEPFGMPTSSAVAPPGGYLDPDAIGIIPRSTTTLVNERMFGLDGPSVARVDGRRVVSTSNAAEGGPSPSPALGAVALRQQILAEAAVRVLSPGRKPLVVVIPDQGLPSSIPGFFQGLDVSWVDLTDLDGLDDRVGGTVPRRRLSYPTGQATLELDAANFTSATSLIDAGETLQDVLLRNDAIGADVADEALTTLSYNARAHPDSARVAADRARAWVTTRLGRIKVQAPPAVTLASSRGRFSATLTNKLDHPVVVRVAAVLDEPMRIEGPQSIQVAAKSRTSVLLDASSDQLGVTNVQLIVTSEAGVPLGSTDELPIRSGQVSQVIWLILASGVALLFGAIVVRLIARIRRARRGTA